MLEYGLNEPQERRFPCRQMTCVSKISKFSEQKRFTKRQKRIRFSKFQLLFEFFLDAVSECAVETFFS